MKYPHKRLHLKRESRLIIHTDARCRVAVVPLDDDTGGKEPWFGIEGVWHHIECDKASGEYCIVLDREGVNAGFQALTNSEVFEEGAFGPDNSEGLF
jgi:hypothetical protein